MNTEQKVCPLDVLSVMDWATATFTRLRDESGGADHRLDVEDATVARAAVAELVEADRAYDAAKAKYGSDNHWEDPSDAAKARFALSAAAARRASALAAFSDVRS